MSISGPTSVPGANTHHTRSLPPPPPEATSQELSLISRIGEMLHDALQPLMTRNALTYLSRALWLPWALLPVAAILVPTRIALIAIAFFAVASLQFTLIYVLSNREPSEPPTPLQHDIHNGNSESSPVLNALPETATTESNPGGTTIESDALSHSQPAAPTTGRAEVPSTLAAAPETITAESNPGGAPGLSDALSHSQPGAPATSSAEASSALSTGPGPSTAQSNLGGTAGPSEAAHLQQTAPAASSAEASSALSAGPGPSTAQSNLGGTAVPSGALSHSQPVAPATGRTEDLAFLNTQLDAAIREGNLDTVNSLLTAGAQFNPSEEAADSPLFTASSLGHRDIVDSLIRARANLERQNGPDGQTALMAASKNGHLAVVNRLIEARPNLEQQDTRNRTALSIAAEKGHAHIVGALLTAGAQENTRCAQGFTPLMHAVKEGHVNVIQTLLGLKRGCVNQRGTNSLSPLMLAVSNRPPSHLPSDTQARIIEMLLKNGADLHAQDLEGCTPLMYAAQVQGESLQAVNSLIDAGARVDDINHAGRSALILAVDRLNVLTVGQLIHTGASITLTDNRGYTAISLATEKGHFGIAQRLRARSLLDQTARLFPGATKEYQDHKDHPGMAPGIPQRGRSYSLPSIAEHGLTPSRSAAASRHAPYAGLTNANSLFPVRTLSLDHIQSSLLGGPSSYSSSSASSSDGPSRFSSIGLDRRHIQTSLLRIASSADSSPTLPEPEDRFPSAALGRVASALSPDLSAISPPGSPTHASLQTRRKKKED